MCVIRNETFTFGVGPHSTVVTAQIFDHKSFGKDKLLGATDIDVSYLIGDITCTFLIPVCLPQIWRYITPGGLNPIFATDVVADFQDWGGSLNLRLEYEEGPPGRVSHSGSFSRTPLSSPSRLRLSKQTPKTPSQD